ncbi:MAG TPA: hypothetical protein VKF63_13305, partial [Terracidiphilus sp.]|nr:hypothetical protein [Terracidiphilus sp.]
MKPVLARKSFGYKILISKSFGYKILRGKISSASLFSRFCEDIGEGGWKHGLYDMYDLEYMSSSLT